MPDTTSLVDQLKSFRRRKMHFAVVVDEYGVMLGVVTLEDIIEEIVGDISDEHDVAVTGVRPQLDGAVNVDGSVPIRDLNRAMDWSLPDEEATTIAGLVIHEARTIPEPGQTFTFYGFRFQVLRKQRNRITALQGDAGRPDGRGRAGAEAGAGPAARVCRDGLHVHRDAGMRDVRDLDVDFERRERGARFILTCTRSSSISTCLATTARISSRNTLRRSGRPRIGRSWASMICSRSRATGADFLALKKLSTLTRPSVRTSPRGSCADRSGTTMSTSSPRRRRAASR